MKFEEKWSENKDEKITSKEEEGKPKKKRSNPFKAKLE